MSEEVETIIASNKDTVRSVYPDRIDQTTIVTICSHSSLQIFDSARRAGFQTLGVIKKGDKSKKSYDFFPLAKPDNFIEVDLYSDLIYKKENKIDAKNPIFIPHGSGVEYLRLKDSEHHGLEILPIPTYGNRRVIPWESSRAKQRQWLEDEADLKMPKEIASPEEISGPVILKLKGAPGGRGAVILSSRQEYEKFMSLAGADHDYEGSTIQEFISGTRYYLQFFASKFAEQNLEFFGIDRRDESDADEFYKLGSRAELLKQGHYPTFNVTGNIPAVLRESLLMRDGLPAGVATVEAAEKLFKDGLIGPFCLETIVTPDSEMYTFEISARIVAGSNVLVGGSPYGRFTYNTPNLNYADRMMIEITEAVKTGRLNKIIT